MKLKLTKTPLLARPSSGKERTTTRASFQSSQILPATLLGCVILATSIIVGNRPIGIGADTANYIAFYRSLDERFVDSRFEPGFFALSWLVHHLGFSDAGFLTAINLALNVSIIVAIGTQARLLGLSPRLAALSCATYLFLFLSPVYSSASINVLRHGVASPLLFASLLSAQKGAWLRGALLGLAAASFHASSWIFLAFAPLLFSGRLMPFAAGSMALLYAVGGTRGLLRAFVPSVYASVMSYGAASDYRDGIRLEFLLFTLSVIGSLWATSRLLKPEGRRIADDSLRVIAVLTFPFLMFGWGAYSDRLLFPAWFGVSLSSGLVCTLLTGSRPGAHLLVQISLIASSILYSLKIVNS